MGCLKTSGGSLPSFAKLLLLLACFFPHNDVNAFSPPTRLTSIGFASKTTGNPPKQLPISQAKTRRVFSLGASTVESDIKSESAADSQNIFGIASDAVTGVIFSLLHAFDDCGIKDSSKNLRVLWVRALLNYRNKIDDDVAQELLPKTTRGLVTSEWGASTLDPILKFAEWIQSRTEFIDDGLENFLSSPACRDAETGTDLPCNVVLFGAGYDTRALRYRHKHSEKISFIEVDLPDVVEGKTKLYEQFRKENDPEWDLGRQHTLIPFNLNDCGGANPTSLIELLREKGGLKKNIPTLFVWEAVLFYVDEDAIRNIFDELFDFAKVGGNGEDARAESMLCFTDSLKPFVDVPFSNDSREFFARRGMDLLQHRSRWGGAVHFALAATAPPKEDVAVTESVGKEMKDDHQTHNGGLFREHVQSKVGSLTNSYIPTASRNKAILKEPSFENTWYAVAFPWQIDGYETPVDAVLGKKSNLKNSNEIRPFSTRLWGEPLVIYRDSNGELIAMADVCPHRSAPLSMGYVENDELVCMYHGWRFGEGGDCKDIPTLHTVDANGDEIENMSNGKVLSRVSKSNCGNLRGVVEHEGLVYVWRGNVLEADKSLLPSRRKGDMETVPIDTVLDYSVDYSYIVENNLDSPHLFFLHDGSVPPIESIGMLNKNLPKLRLKAFTDDCGMGHLGKLGENGRPKKLLRFDPPNVVRHGGVSGFEEEFHIIPIAPQRTRVLLRQHLPRGPILSTVTGVPGIKVLLTAIVNNWNYHIALEDACVMQGQASRIEDWGSPRLMVGGLGDDLIKRYWTWRNKAHSNLKEKQNLDSPYFSSFAQPKSKSMSIPSGTSFGDNPNVVDRVRAEARLRNAPLVTDNREVDPATGNDVGTWGILTDYVQNTPAASFPPINYKQYAKMLVFDQFVKALVENNDDDAPPKEVSKRDEPVTNSGFPTPQLVSAAIVAGLVGMNYPLSEAIAMPLSKVEEILNFVKAEEILNLVTIFATD